MRQSRTPRARATRQAHAVASGAQAPLLKATRRPLRWAGLYFVGPLLALDAAPGAMTSRPA